jgi:hypothetical protein
MSKHFETTANAHAPCHVMLESKQGLFQAMRSAHYLSLRTKKANRVKR